MTISDINTNADTSATHAECFNTWGPASEDRMIRFFFTKCWLLPSVTRHIQASAYIPTTGFDAWYPSDKNYGLFERDRSSLRLGQRLNVPNMRTVVNEAVDFRIRCVPSGIQRLLPPASPLPRPVVSRSKPSAIYIFDLSRERHRSGHVPPRETWSCCPHSSRHAVLHVQSSVVWYGSSTGENDGRILTRIQTSTARDVRTNKATCRKIPSITFTLQTSPTL